MSAMSTPSEKEQVERVMSPSLSKRLGADDEQSTVADPNDEVEQSKSEEHSDDAAAELDAADATPLASDAKETDHNETMLIELLTIFDSEPKPQDEQHYKNQALHVAIDIFINRITWYGETLEAALDYVHDLILKAKGFTSCAETDLEPALTEFELTLEIALGLVTQKDWQEINDKFAELQETNSAESEDSFAAEATAIHLKIFSKIVADDVLFEELYKVYCDALIAPRNENGQKILNYMDLLEDVIIEKFVPIIGVENTCFKLWEQLFNAYCDLHDQHLWLREAFIDLLCATNPEVIVDDRTMFHTWMLELAYPNSESRRVFWNGFLELKSEKPNHSSAQALQDVFMTQALRLIEARKLRIEQARLLGQATAASGFMPVASTTSTPSLQELAHDDATAPTVPPSVARLIYEATVPPGQSFAMS